MPENELIAVTMTGPALLTAQGQLDYASARLEALAEQMRDNAAPNAADKAEQAALWLRWVRGRMQLAIDRAMEEPEEEPEPEDLSDARYHGDA